MDVIDVQQGDEAGAGVSGSDHQQSIGQEWSHTHLVFDKTGDVCPLPELGLLDGVILRSQAQLHVHARLLPDDLLSARGNKKASRKYHITILNGAPDDVFF